MTATNLQRLPVETNSILTRLTAAGYSIYVVGGTVRDLLLMRSPRDVDLATSALPEKVIQLFAKDYCVFPKSLLFGVVTILLNQTPVDIATLRGKENKTDSGWFDDFGFTGSIEEDLKQRDFTINAMAIDPQTGELIDPVDGLGDLQKRLIRAVNDPERRFQEDPLRIVRAIRFAVELNFRIDDDTLEVARRSRNLLKYVSPVRLAYELRKFQPLLSSEKTIQLVEQTGIQDYIFRKRPTVRRSINETAARKKSSRG